MTGRTRLGTRLVLSYIVMAACIMLAFTAGTGLILYLQMRAQVAHFAVQDIETVEGLLALKADGGVVVRDDYHNHAESKKLLDRYVEVVAPDGSLLYRNERLGNGRLGGNPLPQEGVDGYSQRRATLADGTHAVLVSRRHLLDERPIVIRLAQSEEPVRRALELFSIAAALMFPVVIGVATFAALHLSRGILRPIQNIALRAGQITSSRLHERIPVHGTGDEIDQLAEVFNRTLTRLDESFRQLRQFTADASHELRTPLAAIRAIGEVGLERDVSKQEYRELVGSMLEEVNRLTRLVDDLLMVARGDSGSIRLKVAEVHLMDMARDTVALLQPLAEEKDQRLEVSGSEGAVVQGDPVFLRQALINVVHNAIKYSPEGAVTSIVVERDGADGVVISVVDAGPGIALEHRGRIFDRFYRADAGRSRDAGGFGLGLAISQWAVEAHQGSICVVSEEGGGSTFRIQLPVGDGVLTGEKPG